MASVGKPLPPTKDAIRMTSQDATTHEDVTVEWVAPTDLAFDTKNPRLAERGEEPLKRKFLRSCGAISPSMR